MIQKTPPKKPNSPRIHPRFPWETSGAWSINRSLRPVDVGLCHDRYSMSDPLVEDPLHAGLRRNCSKRNAWLACNSGWYIKHSQGKGWYTANDVIAISYLTWDITNIIDGSAMRYAHGLPPKKMGSTIWDQLIDSLSTVWCLCHHGWTPHLLEALHLLHLRLSGVFWATWSCNPLVN